MPLIATPPATSLITVYGAGKLRARGARFWIAAESSSVGALPLATGLAPICAPLVMAYRCYDAINALAIEHGRNPDAPPHLKKVTETM